MDATRKTATASVDFTRPTLTVNIEIDPLVEVVSRHVKLSAKTSRLIKSDLLRLFQTPMVQGSATAAVVPPAAIDAVLSTQAAADLVGVSRPYLVARIDAGDIALHQQVGNQRRVLKSAVMAWHRQEQRRRRKSLGRLGAELDGEIFPA